MTPTLKEQSRRPEEPLRFSVRTRPPNGGFIVYGEPSFQSNQRPILASVGSAEDLIKYLPQGSLAVSPTPQSREYLEFRPRYGCRSDMIERCPEDGHH